MIPAGGDQKFYDNFKKNEADAFRKADNFRASQAQIRQEQANPTVPAGEKKTEQPRDKGGRKRKSSSAEILRYPYDIMDEATDFLMVEVIKYNPPGLGANGDFGIKDLNDFSMIDPTTDGKEKPKRIVKESTALDNFGVPDGTSSNSGDKKEILKTIFLPIPKNIADNNQIDWGESGINALEAFGLKFGQEFINENPLEAAKFAFNAGKDAFSDQRISSDAQNAFVNAISAQAISALGGQVRPGDLISRATGQVLNPNLELLFKNVTLRSFDFTFEFFPRNRREATEVMHIIQCFKAHSSAKKGGGIFLEAPDIFQLSYRKGAAAHPFMNKFKPTVLTNVSVNYTGSNVYSTFYDGTPTHMLMTLKFKELNPIYEEDYWETTAEYTGNFDIANPENSVDVFDVPTGGVGY